MQDNYWQREYIALWLVLVIKRNMSCKFETDIILVTQVVAYDKNTMDPLIASWFLLVMNCTYGVAKWERWIRESC
jgi:hypothetical protein